MGEFIRDNANAFIALLSAVVGAVLTFLGTSILREKDLRLKLREKILDKRIEAHETIVNLSKSLRTMVSLGIDAQGADLRRCPAILMSPESLDEWQAYFVSAVSGSSTWLSNDVTKELNLLQDYIVNLREFLKGIPRENYPQLGAEIYLDFVHFSESIERLAFQFFDQDLEKLKLGDVRKWHKYKKDETLQRLQVTEFFVKVEALANENRDAG